MVDFPTYTTGEIGGQSTNLQLMSTPGVLGTGQSQNGFMNGLQSIVSSIGGSTVGSILGSSVTAGDAIGTGLNGVSGVLQSLSGASKTAAGIDWVSLFLRAVVIIMGFIFVAVGLTMFKGGGESIVGSAHRVGKKIITGK